MSQTGDLYQELRKALAEGSRVAVSSEYAPGGIQKRLVRETDAGAWAALAQTAGREGAVTDGPVVHVRGRNDNVGGDGSGAPETLSVIEYYLPKPRMIVLGGGHIALALIQMAKLADFSVLVFDDRPMFANPERFPSADEVVCDDFTRLFERVNVRSSDFVVIVTRGHKHDKECLEGVLAGQKPAYIGMIGSRRRVAIVMRQLAEAGHPKETLDAVCSPIGLRIGAVTPAEISVAILAEIIGVRRRGQAIFDPANTARPATNPAGAGAAEGQSANSAAREMPGTNSAGALTDARNPAVSELGCDVEAAELLAEHGADMDALITILHTRGSVPRETGAKMAMAYEGRMIGTIGGGCAESGVMQDARAVIREGGWRIVTVDMTDTAEEDGMVCGGQALILIESTSRQDET
jgi:xanthine dehydrogenase accessory factor